MEILRVHEPGALGLGFHRTAAIRFGCAAHVVSLRGGSGRSASPSCSLAPLDNLRRRVLPPSLSPCQALISTCSLSFCVSNHKRTSWSTVIAVGTGKGSAPKACAGRLRSRSTTNTEHRRRDLQRSNASIRSSTHLLSFQFHTESSERRSGSSPVCLTGTSESYSRLPLLDSPFRPDHHPSVDRISRSFYVCRVANPCARCHRQLFIGNAVFATIFRLLLLKGGEGHSRDINSRVNRSGFNSSPWRLKLPQVRKKCTQ